MPDVYCGTTDFDKTHALGDYKVRSVEQAIADCRATHASNNDAGTDSTGQTCTGVTVNVLGQSKLETGAFTVDASTGNWNSNPDVVTGWTGYQCIYVPRRDDEGACIASTPVSYTHLTLPTKA